MSQTALQQGDAEKVLPTSGPPWMWRRPRRGGTGSRMAVEISGVTQCPSDDLITGAWLDSPQTDPVDRYAFEVSGWVVSKAPVARLEFVHEQSVVARCELDVSRPDVATVYGSSSQVGFCKAIRTVGLAPAFTIEVSLPSTLWRINMESAEILDAHFALATSYQNLFAAYCKGGINRNLNPNDKELLDRSDEQIRHYYSVGADATRVIINALLANSRQPPQSILDFPSGSGRVTRHLRAFFPEARIVASDLYDDHLDFCRDAFKVNCLLSRVNVSEIDFGEKFDLIFCGSLLTHLPEASFSDTINLLGRSLSDSGIAVITLQGRFSDHLQATRSNFYLPDQDYEVAAESVRRTGFGYVDYPHNVLKGLFDKEEGYGIALVRPHWVLRLLERRTDLRLLGYVERGWDNHQDVLIFGRPGVNA